MSSKPRLDFEDEYRDIKSQLAVTQARVEELEGLAREYITANTAYKMDLMNQLDSGVTPIDTEELNELAKATDEALRRLSAALSKGGQRR